MTTVPKVTIIIPNWNGEALLRRCLLSLRETGYSDYDILVIDNASTDHSVKMLQDDFPEVDIYQNKENLGYAGGCNIGIQESHSPYVVLLNNDAVVTSGWLSPLVAQMDKNSELAAIQPKVLSIQDRTRFDYCGAAGGEMDIFAYPFARGRLFSTMETDHGQYDQSVPIFWSTGAATLLRRKALDHVGLFDDTFFAHMEEIDQCWRFHLSGYKIRFVPDSVVYHQTGGTLEQESLRKMILNHRNSMIMLLKNYEWITLSWILPYRLMLESLAIAAFLIKGEPKRSLAIIIGFWGVLSHLRTIINGRKWVAHIRTKDDCFILHQLYRLSVAMMYFFFGVRSSSELRGCKRDFQ